MIELSVLAHPADLPFFERTAEHLLLQTARCGVIDRRVFVFDPSGAEPADWQRLTEIGDDFRARQLIDEWLTIDWSPRTVEATMQRWYGDASFPPRAARGRARFQYAYSVDIAQRPLILHLDSDVLLHGRSCEWILQAPEIFDAHPEVVAVVPMGGAPQATRLVEWLLGERFDRPEFEQGQNFSSALTSRHVILHRERVDDLLLPLEDRSPEHHWEEAMSRRMAARRAVRFTDVRRDEYAWHPHRHNLMHQRYLGELIDAVEAGDYPYRRRGHSWDITTEGRRFVPWLIMLWKRRLTSTFRAVQRRRHSLFGALGGGG